ncbi:MAG: LysM domain-containing protein [Saprospiraceae bacterium]
MNNLYPLLFSLLFLTSLGATGDSTHYLLPTDTVMLETDLSGTLRFSHQLEPGQTLFSLAKFYGLGLEEIYAYNPYQRRGYRSGDLVSVPIPSRALIYRMPADLWSRNYAQVFYRVKRGDTLFGISRRAFGMSSDSLIMVNNPIERSGLRPGQLLFVGWLRTDGIPKAWQEESGGPYVRLNRNYKMAYLRATGGKPQPETRGKAAWTSAGSRENGFYALHRTAPIGSYLLVVHPGTRQELYLKVIGRLPDQVYDRQTIIVVSPLVVRAFNIHDKAFYVYVRGA